MLLRGSTPHRKSFKIPKKFGDLWNIVVGSLDRCKFHETLGHSWECRNGKGSQEQVDCKNDGTHGYFGENANLNEGDEDDECFVLQCAKALKYDTSNSQLS